MLVNPTTGNVYTQEELAGVITARPRQPGQATARIQVTSRSISTDTVKIDRQGRTIRVIDPSSRRSPPSITEVGRKKPVALVVPRYADAFEVLAEEVAGQRLIGTDNQWEMPADLMALKADAQQANFGVTEEFVLLGAVRAKIIDSLGDTVEDLEAALGVGPTALTLDFDDPNLDVAAAFRGIKRALKAKLGGIMVPSWTVFATGELYEALVTKESLKRTYEGWQAAAAMRGMSNDGPEAFVLADNMSIQEYEGIDLPSGVPVGPDNELMVIPNIPSFVRYNSPKAGMSTVNRPGQVVYAWQKDLDNDAGTRVDTEMNFIIVNEHPEGVGLVTQE